MSKQELVLTTYGQENFETISLPNNHGRISTRHNLQLEVFKPHQAVLAKWIASGDMSDIRIFSLCSVDNTEAPVRWLANIAQPAMLSDELRQVGIEPPKTWILVSPVHISTASNSRDIDTALQNANNLSHFARLYLEEFHSNVLPPLLEVDRPDYPDLLSDFGSRLVTALPEVVREALQQMSLKRNDQQRALEQGSIYFSSHPDTYGLVRPSLGWMHNRRRSIFILPESERKFLEMMELSREAFTEVGLPLTGFDDLDEEIVIMTSSALRSPHYYHHLLPGGQTEPLLRNIKLDNWVSAKTWQSGQGNFRTVNPNLKGELFHSTRLIEADLNITRDPTALPRLARITERVFQT